jgi:hypothetical protein
MKQPGQLQQPQLPWLPVYCKATTRRDNIIQMWNSKFVYAISIAKMPKRNIDCENFDASGPRLINRRISEKLRDFGLRAIIFCALQRPYGLAVRTPPFHGGSPGSIPGRVAIDTPNYK